SSRRRHTRFSRDLSSDVCSSDLGNQKPPEGKPIMLISSPLTCIRKIKRHGLPLHINPVLPNPDSLKQGRPKPEQTNPVLVQDPRSEERRVGKECKATR